MVVPQEIAKQVIESMSSTPFVLALVLINVMALSGFGYTMHEVSKAIERRDIMIQGCLDR
jgi:hypothetical protein